MEKIEIKVPNKDLSEIKNKYYEKIMNDNECIFFIKNNNISEELVKNNLSKFIKYIESKDNCEKCKGIKNCLLNSNGFKYELNYDEESNLIEVSLVPCDLTINKFKYLNSYIAHDFDENNLIYDLTKERQNPDYQVPRKIIYYHMANLLKKNEDRGFYLYGNRRIGKTFLVSIFSKTYIEKFNSSVAFLDSVTRIKELNDLYFSNKNDFYNELQKYIDVDLLILDDFGNELKNDYVRDLIVYPLLNERYKLNKLTCFTSLYDLDEIASMYSINRRGSPKAYQLVQLIKLHAKAIYIDSLPFRK